MKSILLTRSKLANIQLKTKLNNLGYESLECSLIDYELQKFNPLELNNYTDIIITSIFVANNIPSAHSKGMFAWTVGEKSALILEKKGYKIKFFARDAKTLKNQIPSDIYENTLYLSSDHVTTNMPATVFRRIFYKVTYRKSLSSSQILRYKQGVDYILLYSRNCANTLVKLILQTDLVNYLENTVVIAISSKVKEVLQQYFNNIMVCPAGADSMLKYLTKNDKKN